MNVSLQRNLFAVFLLLVMPLFLRAQQTISLESFEDQPVDYLFSSVPNDPSIIQLPTNGTVQIVEETSLNYVLTYHKSWKMAKA